MIPRDGKAPAQRIAVQLPQARREMPSKTNDLAREAVSCNAGLGAIADGSYAYSDISILTPGMTSGFSTSFDKPPDWTTYEFTVSWSTTTRTPYALQVLNPETYFDSSNAYHVRGKIKNQDAVQHTFVKVFLIMYDANNQVIGVEYDYTNPTTLAAGQEVPFDIDAYFWKGKPDHSQVAYYTIQAYDD